jgi:aminoglycoside 6'-N-acetyltransferase I
VWRIHLYADADWPEWLRMSLALFSGEPREEIERGMRFTLSAEAPRGAIFIAERDDGTACGFVEVGERSYGEGCETSPVGYIEAWYVDPDVRRQGVGRTLLAAAEDWARASGYREMGSDAVLDNLVSHRAHRASGYEEVVRLVVFRKAL